MTTADTVTDRVQLSPEEQAKQEFLGKLARITHRLREQVARRYPFGELRQSSSYSEWLKVQTTGPDGQNKASWLMAGDLVNKKLGSRREVLVSPDGTAFSYEVVHPRSGGDTLRQIMVQPSSLPDKEGKVLAIADSLPALSDQRGLGSGEEYDLGNGRQLILLDSSGYLYGEFFKEALQDPEIQEAIGYFQSALPPESVAPQGLGDRLRAIFQR